MKKIKILTHIVKKFEFYNDLSRTAEDIEKNLLGLLKEQYSPTNINTPSQTAINDKLELLELVERRMEMVKKKYIGEWHFKWTAWKQSKNTYEEGEITICEVDETYT